jgi:flagellar motility protein MotE (MotC chaperone)
MTHLPSHRTTSTFLFSIDIYQKSKATQLSTSLTFSLSFTMIRVAISALLLTVSICDAFVVPSQSISFVVSRKSVGLYAAAEGEQQPESETKEPVFAETTSDKDQEEDEETEPEDEVTFLKQEIADLETILKAKQLLVEYHQEKVEQYSKDGYARKVAEMETMRRSRAVRVCLFVC